MIIISSFLMLGLALGGDLQAGAHGVQPGPVPGWEKTTYSARHTAADLHKYLNGGAARYLAYSIRDLHVQEYTRQADGFIATLELYRMDSPENAFGVYSCDSGGRHPEGIGEQASYGGGLLQFWQGPYYVRVQALDPSGDPSGPVLELGGAVSGALPSWEPQAAGHRGQTPLHKRPPLPCLAASMPAEGMIKDSLCFFHSQVSLNSIYYLSEKNILELSPETDAVSAEYHTPAQGIARVIAVCYPDSATAIKAYQSVRTAEPAKSTTVSDNPNVFAGRDGRLLVLVVEAPTRSDASELGRAVLAAAACDGRKHQEGRK